jgi:hypothetical protein
MRFGLLLFILLFYLPYTEAQTVWTEDFSGGSAARGTSAVGYPGASGGTWSQTVTGGEGASANQWYVSGEECGNAVGTCGAACSNGDASLHVSAIGGLCGTPDCGAAYNETGPANATNRRIESPLINTTGFGGLTLEFGYIAAQGDDRFSVLYSCDGGSSWNTLATPSASQCCSCLDAFLCGFIGICCAPQTQQSCASGGQGYWTLFSSAFPVCAENITDLRIGFLWSNDGNGVGTDPSVAIDDIVITSSNPLPVELVNVAATSVEGGNLISWETLSEHNNSHFIVEHSNNNLDFSSISRIEGKGNSTELSPYSWIHPNPPKGENYYRLRQVDFDGAFEYSQTLLVRNFSQHGQHLKVYPNPATSTLNVTFERARTAEVLFLIHDLSGRVMHRTLLSSNANNASYTLDISGLKPGHYRVSAIDSDVVLNQQFIKK